MSRFINEKQTSYIFGPLSSHEAAPLRPRKRRKVSKGSEAQDISKGRSLVEFPPLFNGIESPTFINLRQQLFVDSWGYTDAKIQVFHLDHVTFLFHTYNSSSLFSVKPMRRR